MKKATRRPWTGASPVAQDEEAFCTMSPSRPCGWYAHRFLKRRVMLRPRRREWRNRDKSRAITGRSATRRRSRTTNRGSTTNCGIWRRCSRQWKKMEKLRHVARIFTFSTGFGIDGFHPTLPVNLTEQRCAMIRGVLTKVEQCGFSPEQTSTTMFFLISKRVTSERPIALLPKLSTVGAKVEAKNEIHERHYGKP